MLLAEDNPVDFRQSVTLYTNGLLTYQGAPGGNLTIEFTEPSGVAGITYGAEQSTNLINWSAVTNSGIGTTNTFTISVGSEPKGFLRLLATEQ